MTQDVCVFKTKAGLPAIIRLIGGVCQYHCGYVVVPKDSKLYGLDYRELMDIDVHGGITFSGKLDTIRNDHWAFGYDCAHGGDLMADGSSLLADLNLDGTATFKDLGFCIRECEKLAQQLYKIMGADKELAQKEV